MILKLDGKVIASDVEFAEDIVSQTRGLMLRKGIGQRYALVFVLSTPRSVSVHMLFVFFPIDVLFLNVEKEILSTVSLLPWIGFTRSPGKAKYIIEMPAGSIERYNLQPGEKITFEHS